MRASKLFLAIGVTATVMGCATIIEGTEQTLRVEVTPDHATCTVTREGNTIASLNNGGGVINVTKSKNDLWFECEATGYKKQIVKIESSASGWGIASCFLVDLCITDYSTGALNKYPENLTIHLQKI